MRRKASQKRIGRTGKATAIMLLASLLLGPFLLPLILLAQSPANEAPVINGQSRIISSDEFNLTQGFVDPKDWSEQDKSVWVNFTLERKNKQPFQELRVEDITVQLNGKDVLPGSYSLERMSGNEPIKILFMVDRSGSMDPTNNSNGARDAATSLTAKQCIASTSSSNGVDKLSAAKESLHYLIERLEENDQAAIYAFDLSPPEQIQELTDKRAKLNLAIESIKTHCKDTELYESINYALEEAHKNDIKIVVILTDGIEDNLKANGLSSSSKSDWERKLKELALNSNIRIFSIALGKQSAPSDRIDGVDYASLQNISKGTNGGFATPIDIPKLNKQSGGNHDVLNKLLIEELKDVLMYIKSQWRYDYRLRVPLSNLKEGTGGLQINIAVNEQNKRTTLSMPYNYTWNENSGKPHFEIGKYLPPRSEPLIVINPQLPWSSLARIYLLLLSLLALLSLLPLVANRITAARELRRIKHAIELVSPSSALQGKQCPNESGTGGQLFRFQTGDTVLVCPKCHTPHHLSCWRYSQHTCMNNNCQYQFIVPARVLARYGLAEETKKQFA